MSFSILQKRDKSYVTKVCVTKSVTKVIVPRFQGSEMRAIDFSHKITPKGSLVKKIFLNFLPGRKLDPPFNKP